MKGDSQKIERGACCAAAQVEVSMGRSVDEDESEEQESRGLEYHI